ncbi:inorganic phosphate transporter [Oleispirillum naphthae]|uniref:inorganic phosphate transporter n=1 Tax=Oleispirillum naphthae TaxID=2838853 RepID=UPI0030825C9C
MSDSALYKDLKRISQIEDATHRLGAFKTAVGLGGLFLIGVLLFTLTLSGEGDRYWFVVLAGVIGGYMALNIGANDVANNVGPAVGSRALPMVGALVIAAVCEAAGAILAGGDVVSTISKGIVDPGRVPDADTFILAMMSSLLAAALWINLATFIGAPVSTTHAVVGGVMGAGLIAAGPDAVAWGTMQAIVASWVISPLLGGLVAGLFLTFIRAAIIRQPDRMAASRRWIPPLIGMLAASFTAYLIFKGLSHVWRPPLAVILVLGAAAGVATHMAMRPVVARASARLENRRKAVSSLFTLPLIFSAALLSFAHGANDVANAVGPLAAIVHAAQDGDIAAKVTLPLWVLVVGALGIAFGLCLFGPKLIRTVGEKITKLDQTRAFCVALSAAVTVLVASAFGLPVSSTHIAVGGVFGVGFLREYWSNAKLRARPDAEAAPLPAIAPPGVAADGTAVPAPPTHHKRRKAQKRRLVRRRHLQTIVAAWLITVPLSAVLAAGIFLGLRTLIAAS